MPRLSAAPAGVPQGQTAGNFRKAWPEGGRSGDLLKAKSAESLREPAGAVAAATSAKGLARRRPGRQRQLEGTSAALLPESRKLSATLVSGGSEVGGRRSKEASSENDEMTRRYDKSDFPKYREKVPYRYSA